MVAYEYSERLENGSVYITYAYGERVREESGRLFYYSFIYILPSYGATAQITSWPPLLRFLNHTQLDTRGRTYLDE
jgi:hypothetical protein